jgi:hypothetical protein
MIDHITRCGITGSVSQHVKLWGVSERRIPDIFAAEHDSVNLEASTRPLRKQQLAANSSSANVASSGTMAIVLIVAV